MMFNRHEIEWTPEKISRMWAYNNEDATHEYFSEEVGDDIIRHVDRCIPLKDIRTVSNKSGGGILDYGCGRGDLIEKLLAHSLICQGADFSKESVDGVLQRFKEHPKSELFKGAVVLEGLPSINLPSNHYDMVFLNATIEHLFVDEVSQVLHEISRILKSDGIIVITTVNDENLNIKKVICPDCGSIFHRGQHMLSWTVSTMIDECNKAGFKTMCCKPVQFYAGNYIPKGLLIKFMKELGSLFDRKQNKYKHLLYIGKKP